MSEFFTCKCGSRWTGHNRSHCSACHVTFGGVASFDKHRQIGRATGKSCQPPQSIGLRNNGNDVWVSTFGESDGY